MTGDPPDYWTPDDITGFEEQQGPTTSSANVLKQNYPNPFSAGTTIAFDLIEAADVSLVIYDLNGNYVKTLLKNYSIEGNYSLYWDGTNDNGSRVASGMYFYILTADNQRLAKKMICIR